MQSSLSAVWLRDRMSRKRKRVLDDRHDESVRRMAMRVERSKLPRSLWTPMMWKEYNDSMGGSQ